jgi:molybdenum cofactor cytidylyltransferase
MSTTTRPSLAGLVLAAGEATRMGRPKQLLPYAGTTLLNHVVAAAAASSLDEVVVVTGAHAAMVESQLETGRATVARNPDYRRGNMSSLAVGAAAVPQAASVLVLMGDMPEVDTEIIERFVARWHEQRPWAAVGEYRDGIAHPFLLSGAALDTVLAVDEPKALWRLLVVEPVGPVDRVTIGRPRPSDINTEADYERLLAAGGSG